ncbi:MAG TPA: OmpA family protein [Puia sp.]|nr:OmpA family protein [Puia sp.]
MAIDSIQGNRWMRTVIIVSVLMTILFYLVKGCNGADSVTSDEDMITKKADTTPAVVIPPARESMKVKLPDGKELEAYRGGIEERLVTFLDDPAGKPGKDVWFDFDNLNFKLGSADITDSSMIQIHNIVAILNAFPKVKVKIGGYTDKTGDSLSNLKLSQNRAEATYSALKSGGANISQLLGAEGYGSEYAKAAADAPDEERRKDRRISVSVRAK